ncbi:addiction module protein [Nesterenkonia alba]|uniref:addiction module protein n=1 Tax=Nesterenkonia alba TaxID=515814 RepID=UPI0003B66E9F|nr:addiction module protein [Nesterenkonia alba]
MVDQALLERTRQLNDAQKRELAYVLLDDVNSSEAVTPYEAAVIDERLADLEANPDDEMSSEEFWKRIRSKFG